MEIRLRLLLLAAAASLAGCASMHSLLGGGRAGGESVADTQAGSGGEAVPDRTADADEPPSPNSSQSGEESSPRVIQPQVERREIKVPHIRSTNFEVGGYYGTLNIEDFGAHPVYGIQAAYHVTEDIFIQAEAGRSKGGVTSFEKLSNVRLLTEGERWFKYYDVSLGYNLFPGEIFLGRNLAMRSTFYLLGGLGGTDFGGDQKFTVNFGAGYKVLPTDWIAVHVAVEDRVFNTDLLGTTKLASNLEAHLGATVFFGL